MFVRYECGCIGIPIDPENAMLVDCCDSYPDRGFCMIRRHMTTIVHQGKKHEPLTKPEELDLMRDINRQLADGRDFALIQSLFVTRTIVQERAKD